MTQFGDMRSFISQSAPPNSYGTSEDIIEYFDCQEAGTVVADQNDIDSEASNQNLRHLKAEGAVLTYNLVLKKIFTKESIKDAIGKGIILKNISQDEILGFGLIEGSSHNPA